MQNCLGLSVSNQYDVKTVKAGLNFIKIESKEEVLIKLYTIEIVSFSQGTW